MSNQTVGGWSMYIPIQTNNPSIKIDEELMLDLKGIKNQNEDFFVRPKSSILSLLLLGSYYKYGTYKC